MHPASRPVGLIILLFLLIPSAAYLWHHDDLPDFCSFHDDCVYFVSAKSLADGQGYRIESLPGQPAQTKYPPLYPLLLSVAWRLSPQFPHNIPIAAWISWLAIPATLLAFSAYLPYLGMRGGRAWLALTLWALNPYIIWFGSQLLTEPLFVAIVLVTLLLLEHTLEPGRATWAFAAGAGAGIAYLTRTAGVALLPVAPLYLIWKLGWKRGKQPAAWFAAAMLPFIVAWSLWSRQHKLQTNDPAIFYYTDYIAYQFANVDWSNLHLVLWKNIDGFLLGLGSLILPKITNSLFLKILAQVIAAAMISGIVRMLRAGFGHLYTMFAVVQAGMLLVWHYPPDERFVLPIFPLALAGLLYELEHLLTMLRLGLRHRERSQRMAAAMMLCAGFLVFGGSLALEAYATAVVQPSNAQEHRRREADHFAACAWIRGNVPHDAVIMANNDPMVHLCTGNPTLRRSLMPRLWYAEDRAGLIDLWGNLGAFARDHRIRYLYWLNSDLSLPVFPEDLEKIEIAHRNDSTLEPVFQNKTVTIFRVYD